ncbi:MAG: DUF2851 family protein [Lentisphaeria bacterium]|nr:DUF2851 family protein [Lentisphaeria bacterium]
MNDSFLSLKLSEASGLYEDALQEYWDTVSPGAVFELSNGRKCTILAPGIRNHGKGPDFTDAVIKIGDSERRGDVELHRKTSDWHAHGHSKDPAYGNVILHAVDLDDTMPGNVAFLPDVPVLCLPDPAQHTPKGKRAYCARWFASLSDQEIQHFFADAGIQRLREKADAILVDMIRHGADAAFRTKFMDLTGVPDAREAFRELENRIQRYDEETFSQFPEAILWGESGLLPDPASSELDLDALEIVRSLWNDFWMIRPDYIPEKIAFPVSSRPQNSPERRLALISGFFNMHYPDVMDKIVDAFLQGINMPGDEWADPIYEMFQLEDAFWCRHSSFRSEPWQKNCALIGKSRSRLLLTDLIMPALHAYFRLTKNKKYVPTVEKFYCKIPANATNRILKIMTTYCCGGREDVAVSAAEQQGLIHIYQSFCSPLAFQCRKCPLRHSLEIIS